MRSEGVKGGLCLDTTSDEGDMVLENSISLKTGLQDGKREERSDRREKGDSESTHSSPRANIPFHPGFKLAAAIQGISTCSG